MMTRYERVSTDCLPLSNGRKPNNHENGRSISSALMNTSPTTTTTSFESNKGYSFKSSSSRSSDHHQHNNHHRNNHDVSGSSPSPLSDQRNDANSSASCGGGTVNNDLFLQWGQKKRARVSRSEIRALADESSSSAQAKQPINKITRRADIMLSSSPVMPPPPPLSQQHNHKDDVSNGNKGGEFRCLLKNRRILEKPSGGGNVSPSRNNMRVVSRSTPEKPDRKVANSRSTRFDKPNGSSSSSIPQQQPDDHKKLTTAGDFTTVSTTTPPQSEQGAAFFNRNNINTGGGGGEKLIPQVIEWPRILIALSRKEKEDDFFAMKGTKLPQRPKKRAKNVDKTLQYCFPGMWLSDLTKSRYEVREKKSVKKQQKRRGLKGMEGIDSDSEQQ